MITEVQKYLNTAWELCEWIPKKSLSQKVWITMLNVQERFKNVLNGIFDKLTSNKIK